MDANLMTPEELRQLADKKEKESQIYRQAFLKEDLYRINYRDDILSMLKDYSFKTN